MISDVRRLRALREVALRGTVTAAAEALGYTPSAVSQQLSSLENEVGTPVLERRGRNVALTDAGRLLVEHGEDVLHALERAETAVAELQGEPVGRVRIGSVASAAASIIPSALRAALAEHPRIRPEVVVHPLDENLRELRLGTIDIAVDQQYELCPHDEFADLDQTVLLTEPLLLLSSVEDPVDHVADAGERPWVASPADSSCGRSTRTIVANAGVAPDIVHETDDHYATVRLVAAGLAVAVVPALALVTRPEGVHASVVPDAHRTISALVRPAARTRPAISAVIDHLVAAAHAYELTTA